MRNYEVTFVVDPVLSGDELKATADKYINYLKGEGCTIVHVDEMGLRPLAYTINKRASGVYYCVEFTAPDGTVNTKFELQLRRDEQMLRFLTVSLDKFGVKYNEDKRAGKIAAARKVGKVATAAAAPKKTDTREARAEVKAAPAVVEAAKVVAAPAVVEAPAPVVEAAPEVVVAAPVVEAVAPVVVVEETVVISDPELDAAVAAEAAE
jgi:small subunit ribosomal protein S6